MLPHNNKIRCTTLAICLFLCFSMAGCETGSTPPTLILSTTELTATPERVATVTPDLETVSATPEPTPAPSGLPVVADVDSAQKVVSAVVGGYYVYPDNGDIYSVPCDDLGAEPILLEPGTITFLVWNRYIVVYARPEAETPYRSILVSPDGSERRVIDKRQSEFYDPIGGVGDYCYGQVDNQLVRYSLSQDMVEPLENINGYPLGIIDSFLYYIHYRTDTVWRYDLETREKLVVFSDEDKQKDYSATAMRGFILIYGIASPTFALLPDGTVHKLFAGSVSLHEPWASTPDYMYVTVHEGDLESPALGTYCINADGVYPMEDYTNGVRIESGADGNVYLPGVDVGGRIPMEDFPIVMEMGVRRIDAQ